MKIVINDGADLLAQLTITGLRPGDSIQALCSELFEQGQAANEKTVLIQISTELVSGSYVGNPAMFARTMLDKCVYPVLQSSSKDGYLIVRASHKKKPMTFRGQVREALESDGTFTVLRSKVPGSYRRRPSMLSAVLTEDLTQQVCNESKGKNRIRWYLKD